MKARAWAEAEAGSRCADGCGIASAVSDPPQPFKTLAGNQLLGVAGLAVAVRVAYLVVRGVRPLQWGDEYVYDSLAQNLLRHGCFCSGPGQPTAWRAPLYVDLLAGTYAVFGHVSWPMLALQAFSGGVAAFFLMRIGSRLSRSPAVSWLAGLMFALHPIIVFATGLLYSESLYLAALLALAYAWLRLADWPANWPQLAIGTGFLLGVMNLMKPNLLFFPLWLLLWGVVVHREIRRAFVMSTVVGVTMVAVLLPWTLRNYHVAAGFVPVSLSNSVAFYEGNNPLAHGGGIDETKAVPPLPELTERERAAMYWKWGTEWIRAHPADFLRLVPLKILHFFAPLETSERGHVTTPLDFAVNAVALVYYAIALLGLWRVRADWRIWLLPLMLIAYPLLLSVVFFGGTRYGLVAQPFIMLLAAEGVCTMRPLISTGVAPR